LSIIRYYLNFQGFKRRGILRFHCSRTHFCENQLNSHTYLFIFLGNKDSDLTTLWHVMPCGVLGMYQLVRGFCYSNHQDGRNLAFTSTKLYGITSQKTLFSHSPYCGIHFSKSNSNLFIAHYKIPPCMYNSFIFPSRCSLLPRYLLLYLILSYDITD
jgi:hypothetical protein